MGEQIKDGKIVVRIETKLKKEYRELCESLGYTFSKRIIFLIKKDRDFLETLK
jgi:antitoxin component of RelBE/YafQ-DinJ toxin-antitoxin module